MESDSTICSHIILKIDFRDLHIRLGTNWLFKGVVNLPKRHTLIAQCTLDEGLLTDMSGKYMLLDRKSWSCFWNLIG